MSDIYSFMYCRPFDYIGLFLLCLYLKKIPLVFTSTYIFCAMRNINLAIG